MLLLLGCSPEITPFGDVVHTDPAGLASENDLTRVRFVFDALADASGLDGLYVPEIRIVPPGSCPHGDNCYLGPGEPLLVGDPSVDTLRQVGCVALADRLGVDLDRGACAEFPANLALAAAGGASCEGLPVSPVRAADTLAAAFPAYDEVGAAVPVTLTRHGVSGLDGELASFVAAGPDLYAWDGEQVVRIDRSTFAVNGRWDPPERPADSRRRFLPGAETPLLVYAGTPTSAWRLDPDAGTWSAVPFPSLYPGAAFYGVTEGDRAWVLSWTDDAAALAEVDLTTGASTPLVGPALWTPDFLSGDGATLLGAASTALLEESFVIADPGAGTYDTLPVPWDWNLLTPVPVGDRVVAPWEQGDVTSLVVRDNDGWHVAEDPCGAARLVDGAWPTQVDGEMWLWEPDPAAPGGAWITEVALGER